jgi:hypothetical protein
MLAELLVTASLLAKVGAGATVDGDEISRWCLSRKGCEQWQRKRLEETYSLSAGWGL